MCQLLPGRQVWFCCFRTTRQLHMQVRFLSLATFERHFLSLSTLKLKASVILLLLAVTAQLL